MTAVLLTVDAGDDSVRTDQVTQSLYRDLRDLGAVTVRRAAEAPDHGAKSGIAPSLNELIVTGVLSSATVAAVYKVVVECVRRSAARSVTWRQGDNTIEVTALSAKDQRKLLERLTAGGNSEDSGGGAGQDGRSADTDD